MYKIGFDVAPYIPDRFSEGYGINSERIKNLKLKNKNLNLIVTVDNGIVATEAVRLAHDLGIDVIITDHHTLGKEKPRAYAIVHTTEICGSGIAWLLAHELTRKLKTPSRSASGSESSPARGETLSDRRHNSKLITNNGLDLCAIGTIADQMPLIGINRSFAKYGIEALRVTKRPGLIALFEIAGVKVGLSGWQIGNYEINYLIAPRINAMGRMENAIDSLRLICTSNKARASELASILNRTNLERQRVVENVVIHAREIVAKNGFGNVIIVSHASYHEGVIGLAAGRLVEEFHRPSIVISKGEKLSKASARSIQGFDVIRVIKSMSKIIVGGGGHPMAAGFTLKTLNIEKFKKQFERKARTLLTADILSKRLKADLEVHLTNLKPTLFDKLEKFEPSGIGNPTPTFMSKKLNLLSVKMVGNGGKHVKLRLEARGVILDAIAFGFGDFFSDLKTGSKIDVIYNLVRNDWHNNVKMELSIRDMRINNS